LEKYLGERKDYDESSSQLVIEAGEESGNSFQERRSKDFIGDLENLV
jgi:hypothetical protein